MEMQWCLIALKSLCRFLLFGMCVLLLDAWTQDDWQGNCQVKCSWWKSCGAIAEGCATLQISSEVFGFQI
jgi:hypothetical protein